jgi:hypothetical protein
MAVISQELGVSGISARSGQIYDDTLRELSGAEGRRIFREMRDTDAMCGACLTAVELLILGVDWSFDPADDTPVAREMADFAQSVIDDMSHSWRDAVSDIITMGTYGWSVTEVVYKRRVGPFQKDPARRSAHTDGRIGIRKLAGRDQSTLSEWKFDEGGGVQAFVQRVPDTGKTIEIPIDRMLLFRTSRERGSPEGRSLLRTAYKAWSRKDRIERIEGVGIERELAGLPVVRIPAEYLRSDASPAQVAIRQRYEKIARDLKFNEQGGLVIPSDPFPNSSGDPSSMPMVSVELLASSGTRAIDTSGSIGRYAGDIARSFLADFLLLGANKQGSFALSKSKTDLFLRAISYLLDVIRDTVQRHLLERLWQLNGLDPNLKPKLRYADPAPPDLEEFGNFLKAMAAVGMPLGADPKVEGHVRMLVGLPELDQEELQAREAERLAEERQSAEEKAEAEEAAEDMLPA